MRILRIVIVERTTPNAAAPAMLGPGDREAAGSGAYKWYMLGVLVLIYIMGTVDRAVLSVIAEPLKLQFHLSDKQVGALTGTAYSVTYALAVLPMGWLIDRMDRRALLSITVAIWSALTAACAMSSSFIMLVAARMGVGAAEAPVMPASLSLIADVIPKRQRNTAVSIYVSGGAVGQILIFIIGGWLLMHFDWRRVFLVAGGPAALLAVLFYLTTREPKRGALDADLGAASAKAPIDPPRHVTKVIRDILGNTALCLAILGYTLVTGVGYSVTVWITSFLVRVHGMTVGQGAIWAGVGFGLCMTVGSLLAGPLADRLSDGDQRRVAIIPAVTTLLGAAAGTVMSLANGWVLAIAGLSVFALMAGFFISTATSLVLSLAAPSERGITMATNRLVSILFGSGLIPVMTGAISDAIGGAGSIRPALLFTTALLPLCTFCYAMIYRTKAHSGCAPALR
ncbi:MAG TPA: MFS transporter [Steroidobacteraceae bacterium]|nr:MFS transporter [Steroidobacteraceae bacterium]